MQRCKNCNEKIVKFPLKDKEGNILWKNLFKMDLETVIWLIAFLSILFAYGITTEECKEIVEDPITFCVDGDYCNLILQIENQNKQYADLIEGVNDFDLEDYLDSS